VFRGRIYLQLTADLLTAASEDSMTTKTMTAPLNEKMGEKITDKSTAAGPRIRTALPGPKAKKVLANDEKYISPSYTRSYPLVAKSGRGIVITDVDGNEFYDFSAGIAVTSTGHCHPEVVAAMQKQAGELIHMSGTDFYYENMVTLAERLSKIAPMRGPHKIYYGNSGAEAIECALKLARYHTKRQNIIAFFWRVPRTHDGSAVVDRLEAAAAAAICAACTGSDACAISRCLPRKERSGAGSGCLCAELRPIHRRKAFQNYFAA
jgi:hypothetical protein